MDEFHLGICTGLCAALALFSFAHIMGWIQ